MSRGDLFGNMILMDNMVESSLRWLPVSSWYGQHFKKTALSVQRLESRHCMFVSIYISFKSKKLSLPEFFEQKLCLTSTSFASGHSVQYKLRHCTVAELTSGQPPIRQPLRLSCMNHSCHTFHRCRSFEYVSIRLQLSSVEDTHFL